MYRYTQKFTQFNWIFSSKQGGLCSGTRWLYVMTVEYNTIIGECIDVRRQNLITSMEANIVPSLQNTKLVLIKLQFDGLPRYYPYMYALYLPTYTYIRKYVCIGYDSNVSSAYCHFRLQRLVCDFFCRCFVCLFAYKRS